MKETTIAVDISQLLDAEKIDVLVTDILDKLISPELRTKISSRNTRKEILNKFGNQAFIYPYKLKFPVINPDTGEYDCSLIYAARARLRQYAKVKPKYADLIDIADNLYNQINGDISINIQINSSKEQVTVDFLDLIEILS